MTRRITSLIVVLILVIMCIGLAWRFLPRETPGSLPATAPKMPSALPASPSPLPPAAENFELPIQQEKTYPLVGGATHFHSVNLKKGQVLKAVVEQEGVDVWIDILTPVGEKVFSVDTPNGDEGEEKIIFFAESSGEYLLRVRGEGDGGYRIRVDSIRLASSEYKKEAEAEKAFHLARAMRGDEPERAVEYFQKAADLSQQTGNRERRANAFERIGGILLDKKDWKAALHYHKRARSLYRSLGDQESEARMLISEGIALKGLAEIEDAEEAYTGAAEIATKGGFHEQAANAFMNRGILRRLQGESLPALNDFEVSLVHWRKVDTHMDSRLDALGNIVHLEGQLGRYASALQVAEDGIRESRGLPAGIRAKILSRIAEVFRSMGDLQWARSYAEWSLTLRQQAGEAKGIANTLVELSLIHREIGNLSEARALLEEALLLFRSKQDLTGEATVLVNVGMVLYEQNDFRQSIEHLQKALRIAKKQDLRVIQAVALYTFALAEYRRGRHEEAKERAKAVLELVDSDKQYTPIEGLEDLYLEAREGIYDLLIKTSIAAVAEQTSAQDFRVAFEAFERGRRRKMLEVMGPVRLRLTPDLVSPDLLERRRQLLGDLQGLREEELRLMRAERPTGRVEERIDGLLEALEALDTKIKVSHPWYPLASPATPVDLDETLELLDEDTALVGYEVTNSRSFAFVVARSSRGIFELPARAEIEGHIDRFFTAISEAPTEPRSVALDRSRKQLSKDLLEPFAHRLVGFSRLVIIPDEVTQVVPFAALLHPDDGDPLIRRYEVVFEPSFSVLKAIRYTLASREPPGGPLAVFAVSHFKDGLPELRHSREEGNAILDFFRNEIRAPFYAFDREATRDVATSGILSQHKVIHFATHAQSHPRHPELSRIVLSGGDLTAREIQELDLRADLVVLSACETARGPEVEGEGPVGLAHAFLYAGAARVVASLWQVDDKATSVFMKRFYYEMYGNENNHNRTPAEALRATQDWMSRHETWSAPYYWSGFQVIGEWQ